MAGPWEKYQAASADGPWKKYGKPTGEQIAQKLVEIGQPGQGPLAMAVSGAEAVPFVGPLLKGGIENMAAIPAMVRGVPYDEAKRNAEMGVQAIQNGNPWESAAGGLGGASGPFVAAGATNIGSRLLGMTGPMWQRALAGGASGFGITLGDSLARGDSQQSAILKALFGAAVGGAAPYAERGISAIVRALMRKGPTQAAQVIARGLGRDRIAPQDVVAQLDALGPEAVPADLGTNVTRQAAAVASMPGEGQAIVRDAMAARNAGANARIQGNVDSILGPAPVPSEIAADLKAQQKGLGPLYEQVLADAKAVDTTPIANQLDSLAVNTRGEAQAVARKLRDMLNITGTNTLDPYPRTLLEVRKAIDGMFDTVQDGNARRILGSVRQQVDEMLSQSAPGIKIIDEEFANLARQNEALGLGQQALDSGRTAMRPAELADLVARSPDAFVQRLSQGARAEIDRIIGTTANNLTALKSALKGDGSWNRDRLVTLFGRDRADALLNVLDREMRYQGTFDQVMRNSETAARLASMKDVSPLEVGQQQPTITGLIAKVPQVIVNAMARGRSQQVNRQIADALMRRPTPEFVDQLIAARRLADRPGVVAPALVPLLTSRGGGG